MNWRTKGKLEEWFNIFIENPFKTYREATECFKKPKWKWGFHLVKHGGGYPYATWFRLGKILDISIHDVWWKDKWNTPRHERNPLIYICLFRKLAFTAIPHIYYFDEFGEKQNGDMEYWEYLINWLYYKKKKSLRCYSCWISDSKLYRQREYKKSEDGSEDKWVPFKEVTPVVAMSLNKHGVSQLKKELENDKN